MDAARGAIPTTCALACSLPWRPREEELKMTTMKRGFVMMALAVMSLAAGCSDSSSGNAFCDSYGKKIAALDCANGGDEEALATICAAVLDAETKCASQYQAILTCQTTTSTCSADGNISFGACEAQTSAYSTCKNQ
jgi:hypothetical protein